MAENQGKVTVNVTFLHDSLFETYCSDKSVLVQKKCDVCFSDILVVSECYFWCILNARKTLIQDFS